jgi:hypothetical protein
MGFIFGQSSDCRGSIGSTFYLESLLRQPTQKRRPVGAFSFNQKDFGFHHHAVPLEPKNRANLNNKKDNPRQMLRVYQKYLVSKQAIMDPDLEQKSALYHALG